jgi:cephalosporin-C deacetylase
MNRIVPLVAVLMAAVASAQELVVTPAKPVYEPNEKVSWKVELKDARADVNSVRYTIKKHGLTVVKEGSIELKDGVGTLESSLDEPGTLLVAFVAKLPNRELKALGGAAVSPERIKPSMPKPEDFDRFWAEKLKELEQTPPNAKLEPADSGKASVEYVKVTIDHFRGSKIYGQFAKPKRGGKFPAMLQVQYAGVYPLQKQWVVSKAEAGWLTLNIMAHDLPFDQPEAFYRKAEAEGLKGYTAIGVNDREKNYFLRMYLSCYRAADFLANHPDWDGRVLVVSGGSQGGQQSIVTAALHPKITALMANVPAGCDVTGPVAGRAFGFPYWYGSASKDARTLGETRYFDVMNFASRVKVPALVGIGLIDETCPPAGVYATTNQFQGPKEIVLLPLAPHQNVKNSHGPFYARSYAWEQAWLKDGTPPVK